jgi:putative transposase
VDRDFTASGPDHLWVADITCVPTATGFLFLAVVLDAWSRRIVGWAMENHLRAELVLSAIAMAVGQRRPKNVIHHPDQGSQYTSAAFAKHCGEAGVRPSMGSVGDAEDNAMAERFLSTLEAELLSRRRFASQAEAKVAYFSYIEAGTMPRDCIPASHTARPLPMNQHASHLDRKPINRPQKTGRSQFTKFTRE